MKYLLLILTLTILGCASTHRHYPPDMASAPCFCDTCVALNYPVVNPDAPDYGDTEEKGREYVSHK